MFHMGDTTLNNGLQSHWIKKAISTTWRLEAGICVERADEEQRIIVLQTSLLKLQLMY